MEQVEDWNNGITERKKRDSSVRKASLGPGRQEWLQPKTQVICVNKEKSVKT